MSSEQTLLKLKSHLSLIKAMNNDKAQDQFFKLMNEARDKLNFLSMEMAPFYYQYADFLLRKMQSNVDLFNPNTLPKQEPQIEQLNSVNQEEDSDSSSQHNPLPSGDREEQQGGKLEAQKQDVTRRQDDQDNGINQPSINQPAPSGQGQVQNTNKEIRSNNQNMDENQNQGEDFEAAHQNFQFALQIYLSEKDNIHKGETSKYSEQEINDMIRKTKTRLGDLYVINQNYTDAIQQYNEVVSIQKTAQNHHQNRSLAEIYYLIGNAYLYDNKEQCEHKAISEYIRAVQILVNHTKAQQNKDEYTHYAIPSETIPKVDRFPYLPKPSDSNYIVQMKDVISCLLDKIEDTHDQIGVRQQINIEKEKAKRLAEGQTGFKQVPKDTLIVNLGTFGNRKKTPQTQNSANGANQLPHLKDKDKDTHKSEDNPNNNIQ